MAFGSKRLKRGDKNEDVVELQLRLSGFRGTVWDGDFGPGTELQVVSFQRDYMGLENPSGRVTRATFDALAEFAKNYALDFGRASCPCGACGGFGQGRYKDSYRTGEPRIEAYHRYEYPGVHKAILHAYRASCFYLDRAGLSLPFLSSGYRCWINNNRKRRKSTNHMGKALDLDFTMRSGEDKRDDANRCDRARAILVGKCDFQIGWGGTNRKAPEPSNIAPTWIHMDVRCYSDKYLNDRYFVRSQAELDG